jgi:hypothetical protein
MGDAQTDELVAETLDRNLESPQPRPTGFEPPPRERRRRGGADKGSGARARRAARAGNRPSDTK